MEIILFIIIILSVFLVLNYFIQLPIHFYAIIILFTFLFSYFVIKERGEGSESISEKKYNSYQSNSQFNKSYYN